MVRSRSAPLNLQKNWQNCNSRRLLKPVAALLLSLQIALILSLQRYDRSFWILKNIAANFNRKNSHGSIQQPSSIVRDKINSTTYFSKINHNFVKKKQKLRIKTTEYCLLFTKILTLITPVQSKIKKSFEFHTVRWKGFLVIPLTTLYDDYINRSNMTDQKNSFEGIAPPQLKCVGTLI